MKISRDNSTEEEIRERIMPGYIAYYANRSTLKSKLVCKKSKLKVYRTIIRSAVTCGSET
jgi:putative component of toxin-antitoxin plasmid stabilization module